ncbi:Bifunctional DNA primase/polymerase, N-terminal [Singulisphaera sp. GP187]|uniref:bifunctional DNA primase/polymerase n=1 Tax=Singulisphaera sp. GP187 TaxID=1882752 RepID=UPI00092A0920|nr:bifunctional DNA primase/polymerase [Singulisphaera sp. GP187]SIO10508.1 Bifunctional DNA primase/polymerase, N-terminal [Singulisphaera sp. GP187]
MPHNRTLRRAGGQSVSRGDTSKPADCSELSSLASPSYAGRLARIYSSIEAQCRQWGEPLPPPSSLVCEALDYHERGFCPIPQKPGAKSPCIKWKGYQNQPPSRSVIKYRFIDDFPDAGIALVLGPAFNLFVVDCDGEEAHRILVDRLGGLPPTPTVLSGSGLPHKYHLYFQHPALPTNAKFTPWHRNLEFRGYRGIVIAPPSLHKSGNRYRWAEGRSLDDVPMLEVPGPILEALQARESKLTRNSGSRKKPVSGTRHMSNIQRSEQAGQSAKSGFCLATREFLAGTYADEPGWNDRLFRASADMVGCGYEFEEALPLLMQAAGPWSREDQDAATRTIESAFSQERVPARVLAAERGLVSTGKRGSFTLLVPRDINKY